jgi:hypothetical protein
MNITSRPAIVLLTAAVAAVGFGATQTSAAPQATITEHATNAETYHTFLTEHPASHFRTTITRHGSTVIATAVPTRAGNAIIEQVTVPATLISTPVTAAEAPAAGAIAETDPSTTSASVIPATTVPDTSSDTSSDAAATDTQSGQITLTVQVIAVP